jgi:3-deoxy-D-manno-octulosonic-acid transferase
LLYDLAIALYHTALRIAGIWHPKARLWANGRIGLLERVGQEVGHFEGTTVWVHCASLGEFEMARPIMEALKAKPAPPRIVLTFFSPSGYEIRKGYDGADHVFYLPREGRAAAQRFIAAVRPRQVIFVKYDLWWHFLKAAKESGAQLVLISAVFTPQQYFFKWYGAHGRRCLALFDRIFTVDAHSAAQLHSIGIYATQASGDTRYDRVMQVAGSWAPMEDIVLFKGDKKLVVCGSTWPEDEEVLRQVISEFPEVKWIIAPHEVGEASISRLMRMFPKAVRHSQYQGQHADVLIIDSIGLLNRLYGHADVAYVGGGFGRVLHNVLEATAYGIPVIFGPDMGRFLEAYYLVQKGWATSVSDGPQLRSALQSYMEGAYPKEAVLRFMHQRTGATHAVLSYLLDKAE